MIGTGLRRLSINCWYVVPYSLKFFKKNNVKNLLLNYLNKFIHTNILCLSITHFFY
jgi:hypothetical protein